MHSATALYDFSGSMNFMNVSFTTFLSVPFEPLAKLDKVYNVFKLNIIPLAIEGDHVRQSCFAL